MSTKEPADPKPVRTLDSGFRFSLAIGIGLILFIAGLVVSLTLGNSSSIGVFFGVPLLFAGLAVPLIMMRDQFKRNEVSGACPYCGTPIKTSDATIRLACPNCMKEIAVRDEKLCAVE